MQSFKSKLFIGLIKNRHLFKFKLKPETVDDSFDVKKFRDDLDKMSDKLNKVQKDIKIESIAIDGMNAELIIPEGARNDKLALYIHGGGFISGSCRTHRMHVIKIAKICGLKILLFDYRLAPEHPFPAAVEDCVKAYNWLLSEGYKNTDLVIMGESAGGTLTLSALIALRDRGIELPKAAVSISPVTDLTCAADSFRTNAKKDVAPQGSWTTWTGYYIGENNPHDTCLSPQLADLAGLPPLMIHVGTHEIHLDDARNFGEKARVSGVTVSLKIWEGMIHAFPLLVPLFPEAVDAMNEIRDFVRNYLGIKAQGEAIG